MKTLISDLATWLEGHQALLSRLGTISLIMLAVTVIVFPAVVIKLPKDYFIRDHREPVRETRRHPLAWGLLSLVKNFLGLVLILAGLAMLVLPGQGTVTILIGVALTNFPGKYKIERRIAAQPAVGKTLNRIRGWTGAEPLSLPTSNRSSDRPEGPDIR